MYIYEIRGICQAKQQNVCGFGSTFSKVEIRKFSKMKNNKKKKKLKSLSGIK
jgi:hypothetical protein